MSGTDALSPGMGVNTPYNSPAPSSSNTASPANASQQQPTVRVMRLYKPGLHCVPSFLHSTPTNSSSSKYSAVPALSSSSSSSREAGHLSDFAISPFLLLPDSFGDIYMGQTFSAYVAVVNGMQDAPFHHVSLTLRLLATNATYDLVDTQSAAQDGSDLVSNTSSTTGGNDASAGKTLEPNAYTDTVVSHVLSEPGTHTLRVSVQYLAPTRGPGGSSELKTLRKFYRFNVLQPLVVTSTCVDQGLAQASGVLLVQVRVTNSTQSAIFLENVAYVATASATDVVEPITIARAGAADGSEEEGSAPLVLDSLPLLLPGESFAQAFRLCKPSQWRASVTLMTAALRSPLGHPIVTWRSQVGERGTVAGDPTMLMLPETNKLARSSSFGNGISTPPPAGGDVRKRVGSSLTGGPDLNNAPLKPGTPGLLLLSLDFPSKAVVGREFSVQLLCKNTTQQPAMLFLQTVNDWSSSALPNMSIGGNYNSSCNGLCVTGLTGVSRGTLQPGESMQTSITVFPLTCGLFELSCLAAVDKHSGAVYPAGCLGRVFVAEE